jgi:hypothetical protein
MRSAATYIHTAAAPACFKDGKLISTYTAIALFKTQFARPGNLFFPFECSNVFHKHFNY